MSRPVDVQRFLCLRCSGKDKWTLLYLGAVLDCDGPILEALAWTSMFYVALKAPMFAHPFLICIKFMMLTMLTDLFGPPKPNGMYKKLENTIAWLRPKGTLSLKKRNLSVKLQYKTIVKITSIELHVEDEMLFKDRHPSSKKAQPFRPGEFDNFVETTVNTILALSA